MSTQKRVRILTLDGGGIRGIIPATIIQYAEEYLAKKKPGTTIADHFDLIAGTSTGGLLAGFYLAPQDGDPTKAKYKADEALKIYQDQGYNIFNGSKRSKWKRLWGLLNATAFSPKFIESILHEKFGDLKMSELIKPCLITTYDMNMKSSFFFTSMEDTQHREFYVRDVLRSTSAAPTYFPPARVKNLAPSPRPDRDPMSMINLDGGVFANNPTMCAYAEARNTNFESRGVNEPTASQMSILSIATGGGGFELKGKHKSNKWNLLKWATSIPEIMMDGSVDTVAFQMQEINGTLGEQHRGSYHRIKVPDNARIYASDMSDASPGNIKDLVEAGKRTLDAAIANGLNDYLDSLLDGDE